MSRRGWGLFVAISLLWGLPYLLIKVAVSELDPLLVVFLRAGVAALVLLPVAVANGALRAILPRWRAVVLLATVEMVGPFLLSPTVSSTSPRRWPAS